MTEKEIRAEIKAYRKEWKTIASMYGLPDFDDLSDEEVYEIMLKSADNDGSVNVTSKEAEKAFWAAAKDFREEAEMYTNPSRGRSWLLGW
jgi:hypothetical protein